MLKDKRRLRAVGMGMSGIGGLLAAVSIMVGNGYWLLLTGSVFLAIGLIFFFASLLVDEES